MSDSNSSNTNNSNTSNNTRNIINKSSNSSLSSYNNNNQNTTIQNNNNRSHIYSNANVITTSAKQQSTYSRIQQKNSNTSITNETNESSINNTSKNNTTTRINNTSTNANSNANSSKIDNTSDYESSIEDTTNSPISRYIKSLDLLEHSNLPGIIAKPNQSKTIDKPISQKNKEKSKSSKVDKASTKLQLSSVKSLPKSSPKSSDKLLTYTPNYESSWFQTEDGLSLEMYLKRLFQIARDKLSCNLNKDTTKAILVPHAGIKYSGICSASAYYELYNRTKRIHRIILLCTNHHTPSHSNTTINTTEKPLNIIGTSYNKIASYRLGKSKLSIDTKTMDKLKPYIEINDTMFENEHSFFNQLPFIETVASDALICPLLIGNMTLTPDNNHKLTEIMQILKRLLMNEGTVLVCTSDLSHINGHFQNKIQNYIAQNIRKSDSEMLQFLYNVVNGIKTRTNKIDEMLFLQNSPACGIMAMYVFGKLLNSLSKDIGGSTTSSSSGSNSSDNNNTINNAINKHYFNSRVCCYYTSLIRDHINTANFNNNMLIPLLDITDTSISSVSYAGVVFTTQKNIQTRKLRKIDQICSEYEKIALLGLAREQLYYKLLSRNNISSDNQNHNQNHNQNQQNKNVRIKVPDNLIRPIASPVFDLHLGCFTTLHKSGRLRGCIGTLETDNDEATIETNVKKYIQETAFRDSRFSPVDISEFNKLEFSITILYTLKPISLNEYFGNKFVLGRDGIMISRTQKQGYFLPTVATEFKYNKQQLLEELCTNKMNNTTKECFRGVDAKLFYNEGIEFSTT